MILIRGQLPQRVRLISLPLGVWLAPTLMVSVIAAVSAAQLDRSLAAWTAAIITISAILIATVIVGQSPVECLTLDAGSDRLEVSTRNLLTRRRTLSGPYPLRDLMQVRESRTQDAAGDPVTHLQLCLHNGTSVWFPETAETTNFTQAISIIQQAITMAARESHPESSG